MRKPKKTSIYDVYEPSELERGYFTEKDAEIRVTDMPERFQVRKAPLQIYFSRHLGHKRLLGSTERLP